MIKRLAQGVGLLALYLVLYELASLIVADHYKLPSIARLAPVALDQIKSGVLWEDFLISLARITAGFGLGLLGAIVLVVVMGVRPWMRRLLEPGLRLLRAIPAIALVPVAILIIGLNFMAQTTIIALASILPMWVALQDAADVWHDRYGQIAASLHLTGRETWLRVRLPLVVSTITRTARIGVGIACYSLVASEMLGAGSGLMYRANLSYEAGRMPAMYVSLLWLGILCLVIDRVIDVVQSFARPTEVTEG